MQIERRAGERIKKKIVKPSTRITFVYNLTDVRKIKIELKNKKKKNNQCLRHEIKVSATFFRRKPLSVAPRPAVHMY